MEGEEFSWLIAGMVFFLYLLIDMVYAKYTIAVTKGEALKASAAGAAIYGFGALGVMSYVQNPWYVVPMIMGAFIGTYVIVSHEAKSKK